VPLIACAKQCMQAARQPIILASVNNIDKHAFSMYVNE